MKQKVIIIGGGAMGLFSAYHLLKAGYQVMVLDEGSIPGVHSCSSGNAGMIVPSHFTPLSTPEMVKEGLHNLLKSGSPFGIRWSGDPDLLSFLWKFFISSRSGDLKERSAMLANFHLESRQIYLDVQENGGIDLHMEPSGLLMVCKKEKSLDRERRAADKALHFGVPAELWSAEKYREHNQHLNPQIAGAVLYPMDGKVDPFPMLKSLSCWLASNGADLVEQAPVTGVEVHEHRIEAVISNGQRYPADHFLVTAGIASRELAIKLGTRIPMQPGRGVSVSFKNDMPSLSHPTLLQDAHVAITPYPHYTRLSGGFLLGEHSRYLSLKRLNAMVRSVREHYPDWNFRKPEIQKIWSGFRPVTPDGLPLIGKIPQLENGFLNTGHAMMGISLAPVSGKLITQWIGGLQDMNDPATRYLDPARWITG